MAAEAVSLAEFEAAVWCATSPQQAGPERTAAATAFLQTLHLRPAAAALAGADLLLRACGCLQDELADPRIQRTPLIAARRGVVKDALRLRGDAAGFAGAWLAALTLPPVPAGGGGGGGGGGEGGFDFEIEVEAGGEGKDDAMSLTTLFEQPSSRNQLIDDLIELQGFFAQSAAELKAGGAVSALPLELQLDQAEVEARLGAVNGVLSILEDEHTKHLWLLGTSDQVIATDGL